MANKHWRSQIDSKALEIGAKVLFIFGQGVPPPDTLKVKCKANPTPGYDEVFNEMQTAAAPGHPDLLYVYTHGDCHYRGPYSLEQMYAQGPSNLTYLALPGSGQPNDVFVMALQITVKNGQNGRLRICINPVDSSPDGYPRKAKASACKWWPE
jgi:hypothetical protein